MGATCACGGFDQSTEQRQDIFLDAILLNVNIHVAIITTQLMLSPPEKVTVKCKIFLFFLVIFPILHLFEL